MPAAESVKFVVPLLLVRVAKVIQFDRLVEARISRCWPRSLDTVQVKGLEAGRWGDRRRIGVIRLKGALNATWPAPSSAFRTTLVAACDTVMFPFQTPPTKAPAEVGLMVIELEKATE